MKRLAAPGALLVFVAGCGGGGPHPATVLTSPHFTLYAYGDAPASEATLDWLEGDYRDARAFLKFPETHIGYHLFPTAAASGEACYPGSSDPITACARGPGNPSVYTNLPIDHHELLHAYMFGIGVPPPILREGIAQGVSCSPAGPSVMPPLPDWRTTATLSATEQPDVYAAGLALFVYLTRTHGIDRFVEYYGSARDTRSADVFRQEFEAFWDISLDTAWQEMQAPARPGGAIFAVCPCTQPPVPLDGAPIDPATIDTSALPLPDGDRGPYMFVSAVTSGTLRLTKCAHDFPPYQMAQVPDKPDAITLARLLPEPYYIDLGPGASLAAKRGDFVAPTCDGAVPVTVPPGYRGTADVVIVRAQDDPLESEWYARFAPADARRIRVKAPALSTIALDVCSSCDANGSGCMPLASGEPDLTLNVPGPEFVVHLRYGGQLPGVVAPATVIFLDP